MHRLVGRAGVTGTAVRIQGLKRGRSRTIILPPISVVTSSASSASLDRTSPLFRHRQSHHQHHTHPSQIFLPSRRQTPSPTYFTAPTTAANSTVFFHRRFASNISSSIADDDIDGIEFIDKSGFDDKSISRISNDDESSKSSSSSNEKKKTKKKKQQQRRKSYYRRPKQQQQKQKKKKKEAKQSESKSRSDDRTKKDLPSDANLHQQLEQLYDEIAPLVRLGQLRDYIIEIENSIQEGPEKRQQLVDKSSKQSHHHQYYDQNKNKSKSNKTNKTKTTTTKPPQLNHWCQSKLLSFLEILPFHATRPIQTMKTPADYNMDNIRSTATILRHARDKSLIQKQQQQQQQSSSSSSRSSNNTCLEWSQNDKGPTLKQRKQWHSIQTEKNLQREARAMATILAERLPSNRFFSLISMLSDYVETSSSSSSSSTPPTPKTDDNVHQHHHQQQQQIMTSTGDDADAVHPNKKKKKKTIRLLFGNVAMKVGIDHLHLVAPELARFFYFDPPPISASVVEEEEEVNHHQQQQQQKASSVEERRSSSGSSSIADKEDKVILSKEKWEETKEDFVKRLLVLYKMIHDPSYNLEEKKPSSSSDDDIIVEEEVADYLNEEEEDEDEDDLEALTEIVSSKFHQKGTAAIQKTNKEEGEDASNKSSSNRQPKKKKRTKPEKEPRKFHLIYDTLVVEEFQDRDKEYPLSSETTVFVDNLPIDIKEDELKEYYSRCLDDKGGGEIESVEIFNRKPELDPGKLSEFKLKAMAKEQRKRGRKAAVAQSQSAMFGKWTRPRSPVYAMLTFTEEEDAKVAAQDSLRIFGMIVRGHAVRSLRSKEMTRLYVDNIEKDLELSAMDIEFMLSQLLNPGLFVSMDISSSTHRNSKRVVPGSFEIMLPSFEVASEAFLKLQNDLELVKESDSCTINWFRTPGDAQKYWTRELGGIV